MDKTDKDQKFMANNGRKGNKNETKTVFNMKIDKRMKYYHFRKLVLF